LSSHQAPKCRRHSGADGSKATFENLKQYKCFNAISNVNVYLSLGDMILF